MYECRKAKYTYNVDQNVYLNMEQQRHVILLLIIMLFDHIIEKVKQSSGQCGQYTLPNQTILMRNIISSE